MVNSFDERERGTTGISLREKKRKLILRPMTMTMHSALLSWPWQV